MKHFLRTAPKPQNEKLPSGMRPNEDAALADPEQARFAVADGAGGTGIFSGPWAQYLLNKLPPQPISSYPELTQWLDQIWEPFYQEKAAELEDDGLRLTKFYAEGSAATLLAIWKHEKQVHWMAYGDSNLLWLDAAGKYKGSFPAKALADFTQFPHLVNWNDEWMRPVGFAKGIVTPTADDRLLLATDALSQSLLLWAKSEARKEPQLSGKQGALQRRFQEAPPEHSLVALLDELEQDFAYTLQELQQTGYLLNDDCSLVSVQV